MIAEVSIAAPASAAWTVLGERFAHIGEWAAPITDSTLEGALGVGAVRTCHIAGFGPVRPGAIKERLVYFDPEAMRLTYEAVEGMPGFIRTAINRWSVEPAGEARCVVRTHATLTLRGPMALLGWWLRRRTTADAALVLDELRHRVEHGAPHPRKAARQRASAR